MTKNPDNKTAHLAQVGFTFENVDTSLIGIRHDHNVDLMETPRLVIMQPPHTTERYEDFHEYYDETLTEIKEKLGNRSDQLQIVRGDIYKPEDLQNLPTIAFLVLENVLSDPFYQGDKNFELLIHLLQDIMVKGGIILTLDSRLYTSEVKDLVQTFSDTALKSGSFATLLSLLEFGQGIENIQNRDSNQPIQIMKTELQKLNVVDAALDQGLDTLKLGIYHCLILQKID